MLGKHDATAQARVLKSRPLFPKVTLERLGNPAVFSPLGGVPDAPFPLPGCHLPSMSSEEVEADTVTCTDSR